ncbi:MAG: NIF family HAD-type phosphatase [Archangium sp.]
MPRFALLLLLALPVLGCATSASQQRAGTPPALPSTPGIASRAELDALTIPLLPDWVDKYATPSNVEERRFFNISHLMERFQLDRAQAVELQNHYRDQVRSRPTADLVAAFNTALERVRRGEFESFHPDRLAQARFIVVFDLDETLLDQYYGAGASCHDLAVPLQGGAQPSFRYVKLIPGWQQAFERIQALGGAIVLFTANRDELSYENLAQWRLGGIPLTVHPAIAGILTNSHLILQEKSEGVANPKDGNPVHEPSKDLRIFDETLRRVVIVDDNPTRLFQMRNARVIKKFDADLWCTTSEPLLRRAFDESLPTVTYELEESVRYMNEHGVDFAEAFLPYTALGQLTVQFLVDSSGFDRARAIDYVRHNPQVVDAHY